MQGICLLRYCYSVEGIDLNLTCLKINLSALFRWFHTAVGLSYIVVVVKILLLLGKNKKILENANYCLMF